MVPTIYSNDPVAPSEPTRWEEFDGIEHPYGTKVSNALGRRTPARKEMKPVPPSDIAYTRFIASIHCRRAYDNL